MITKNRRQQQLDYKRKRAARLKRTPPRELTHERLLQVIHYDQNTGTFTRIGQSGKRTDLIGERAGGPTSDGYLRVAVDDRRYRAHRLAWFYMTGRWPNPEVDHRNHMRTDNRWENLREATSAINKQNRLTANCNNKTGMLGVSHAPAGKFRARIDHIHLGVFDTPEDAHRAYLEAKRERHEGCLI